MQTLKIKISIFILIIFWTGPSFSQGFIKLKDKYGQPSGTGVGQTELAGTSEGQDTPKGIEINGVDIDIRDLIEIISNATGKDFLLDKSVSGKITILSDKRMTPQEAYETFLSALEVNGYTTFETPTGLVRIIKQKDSQTRPKSIFSATQDSPDTDNFITRIIQLTNISANELGQILTPMVSKDGKLLAYPTTNSLIVTDTGSNIQHILKLVKELDQEGPQEVLQIIPIINADAKDIALKITQIFDEEQEEAGAARRPRRRTRTQETELEDVQSISKVIADDRTNSVIIKGTKRSILKVKVLIAKLDRSISGVEGSLHVYRLQHADAIEMADVLNTVISGVKAATKSTSSKSQTGRAQRPEPQQNKPDDVASVNLQGDVKVTADEANNALVISASPKDYATLVDKVISQLDIIRPQVYLEAHIMSLEVDKSTNLGTSGQFGGSLGTISGNTLRGFSAILPSFPTSIATIAGASGGIAGGVSSDNTLSFTDPAGNVTTIPAVSGLLMALKQDRDVNVLSSPSIMTLDNQKATIHVGQEVPVNNGTTVGTGGVTTFDVSRQPVGITLEITPQISIGDTIRLEISQQISNISASSPTSLDPILDDKSIETVVIAKNRQTIVIGGLMDDQASMTTGKVPLLGDIPVLGYLFKTKVTRKNKKNLIIFITPYIVRERKDYLTILKKKLEERNAFVNENYGLGQRKLIRKAIDHQASDLLEFKCQSVDLSNPCLTQVTSPKVKPESENREINVGESDSEKGTKKYRRTGKKKSKK